jgi:3-oxoacid CoA-transferase B subunit
LLAEGRIRRLTASFPVLPEFYDEYFAGRVELELVPQGTLAERLRAGGSGIPAFYTPSGAGTMLADGTFPLSYTADGAAAERMARRETRDFGGREHVLEYGIVADFGLVKADQGDRKGNLRFRLRPELQPAGGHGRAVHVRRDTAPRRGGRAASGRHPPARGIRRRRAARIRRVAQAAHDRGAGVMTETVGPAAVRGLSREGIAERLARDLRDGFVVNLGVGIPLLVPRFIPAGAEVVLPAENGVLSLGPARPPGQEDPDLTDAGKKPVTLISGAAIVDSAMSFAIVRGGHLDVTVLGALQVSAHGDLANWYVPGRNPAVGGAMDLVAGAREVWVVMEHVDRAGQPKIVKECAFPLTGRRVVTRVYTDLAVFHLADGQLRLKECAPGVPPAAIRERTAARYVEDFSG